MLMVRLILELLARRRTGEPVPVLLSAASWNPSAQDLRGWLETVLTITYPVLSNPVRSAGITTSRVRALLDHGLVLPILDGLDEIPDITRGPAIARINEAFQPDQHFVVTCRTGAFKEAVRPDTGIEVTLRGAAGIELCPLDDSIVSDYLRTDAGGPVGAKRWEPVLDELATCTPLAEALSTPLMAGLARTIYNPRPGESSGVSRQPSELRSLSNATAIEEYLLDAFIPASYRQTTGFFNRQSERYARNSRKWLSFLAGHLETNIHGTDFVWWQLSKATPRLVKCIAMGLIAGLTTILAIEVTIPLAGLIYYGLYGDFLAAFKVTIAWVIYGLKLAFISGLISGAVVGIVARLTTLDEELRHKDRTRIHDLLISISFGCASGAAIALAIWSEIDPPFLWLVGAGLISAVPARGAFSERV